MVNLVSDRGSNPRASTQSVPGDSAARKTEPPIAFQSIAAVIAQPPKISLLKSQRHVSPLRSREYTTPSKAEHEIHVWQADDSAADGVEQSEISRELLADESKAERIDDVIVGNRKHVILGD